MYVSMVFSWDAGQRSALDTLGRWKQLHGTGCSVPGPDVLLPTAGAMLAAATSSTLDADWLQRAGAAAK
jgi:hypothetical protein